MTTINRAIVEQALECLKGVARGKYDGNAAGVCAALEAALAQQAEPVATVTECEACFTPDVCQLRGTCDYYTASQMRIAAPPQQAKPVEPVARVVEHGATVRLEWVSADAAHNAKVGPLFSMPPQRKPLTDEEIDRIRADCVFTPHEYRDRAYGWALHFARAVERAHGIPMPEAPTCPDCHGIGYDASGQTCACQENPSF